MKTFWPINQILLFWATLFIIIFFLKYTSDLIIPLLISIVLTIILLPLFNYFIQKKIPKILALFFIICIALIPSIILGEYISEEVTSFTNNFQHIRAQFDTGIEKVLQRMHLFGLNISQESLRNMIDYGNLGEIVKNLVSQTSNQFSNIFLIFFTVGFMLMESDDFSLKVTQLSKTYKKDVTDFTKIIKKIQSYFSLKVKTSLLTGISIFFVLWLYDVHYAYLWAILAFFLNFIPVIGSIIAALPPIIITLIEQDITTTLWVTFWILFINTIVGNVLEPRIMGKGLGLTPLTIFISMTFWGWMFGPAGMILSASLTVVVQFLFSQHTETQWIALIMGEYPTSKITGDTYEKNDHAPRT